MRHKSRQGEREQRRPVEWPDRWALWLLEATLPKDWREPLIGDLLEEWSAEVVSRVGRASARWWLLRQVCLSAAAAVSIHFRRITVLSTILFVAALLLGGFAAYVDSRPTWNDTGVLACGILIACAVLGFLEPTHPWRWALAVGLWIPVNEIGANRSYGSLLALGFAGVGVYLGAGLRRVFWRSTSAEESMSANP